MDVEAVWRRAAAYVVCRDSSGRILLTRLRLPGSPRDGEWTLPGGGMEWGEDPVDTAARELAEETGLAADIGTVLGVWSQWFPPEESQRGEPGHVLAVVFDATHPRLVSEPDQRSGTTSGHGWFTVGEVASLPRVPLVDFGIGRVADDGRWAAPAGPGQP